jgi:hypothetical protein
MKHIRLLPSTAQLPRPSARRSTTPFSAPMRRSWARGVGACTAPAPHDDPRPSFALLPRTSARRTPSPPTPPHSRPHAQELNASACDLQPRAFDGLSFPSLQRLFAAGNARMRSLSGLAAACGPSLRVLHASGCGLTDLGPLTACHRLERTWLDSNRGAADLTPLTQLPALKWAEVDKGGPLPPGLALAPGGSYGVAVRPSRATPPGAQGL